MSYMLCTIYFSRILFTSFCVSALLIKFCPALLDYIKAELDIDLIKFSLNNAATVCPVTKYCKSWQSDSQRRSCNHFPKRYFTILNSTGVNLILQGFMSYCCSNFRKKGITNQITSLAFCQNQTKSEPAGSCWIRVQPHIKSLAMVKLAC